jgi:peptide/nickel transport system ATP-binding protein
MTAAATRQETVSSPVLAVRGLSVHFPQRMARLSPVDDVTFALGAGETLALLGESGCGKSMTVLAVMGLLPGRGFAEGAIELAGQDLAGLSERAMSEVRGKRIGMVFQDALTALNPLLTVGRQLDEVLARHTDLDRAARRQRAIGLLGEVGITDPERRLGAYPHQMSGGMCQRVMIAIALSCDPELLIADEPTTALDVTVQKQILELIAGLRCRRGTAVLLITHDLGVVVEAADRVAVMYAGRIVEQASVTQLFAAPAHPYTIGLMRAMPKVDAGRERFAAIPGSVPDLADMPPGCRFAPRCSLADARCHATDPGLSSLTADHGVRCWYPQAPA